VDAVTAITISKIIPAVLISIKPLLLTKMRFDVSRSERIGWLPLSPNAKLLRQQNAVNSVNNTI